MIFQQQYVQALQIRQDTFIDKVNQFRKIIHVSLEEPQSSTIAKHIQGIIIVTIIMSFIQILMDSLYDDQQYLAFSFYLESCIFSIFSIELIFRLFTFTAYGDKILTFLYQPLNLIDVISVGLGLVSLIWGQSSLNGLRMLKLFKSIRVVKLNRYIKGIDILQESVGQSFKQFYYLIIGFNIIALAYGVAIYYCEQSDNDAITMGDSVWLGIVTMTSVGYGDYVPKSLLGMIITSVIALIANTVIFSMPIAILHMDFQETYDKNIEDKKIRHLKFHSRNRGSRRQSIKNNTFNFFNERLSMIENKNKEIQELLDQSNTMAIEVTQDLKKLFESVNQEEDSDQYHSPSKKSTTQILMIKTKLYEKLVKAKRKIQITNIFKEGIRKKSNHEIIKRDFGKIKSHSIDNENELLKMRNEEYGELPYDFLNEVLLQLQDEIIQSEDKNYKRSTTHFINQADQRQHSFGIQSFLEQDDQFKESPEVKPTHSASMYRIQKMSDMTSEYFRRQNKGTNTILNMNESGYRSATEHSSQRMNRKYQKKQIEDFREKKKPKAPPQFLNNYNDLKQVDNYVNGQSKRKVQQLSQYDLDKSPSRRQFLKKSQNNDFSMNESNSFIFE